MVTFGDSRKGIAKGPILPSVCQCNCSCIVSVMGSLSQSANVMQVVNSSKTVPKSIKDVPFCPWFYIYTYIYIHRERLEDRGLSRTFGLPAIMGQTSHLVPFANSLSSVINQWGFFSCWVFLDSAKWEESKKWKICIWDYISLISVSLNAGKSALPLLKHNINETAGGYITLCNSPKAMHRNLRGWVPQDSAVIFW